jgi:hypothetical protein
MIRARIDRMLSPALGPLASLAASLRERVERLVPTGNARRAFWSDFFEGAPARFETADAPHHDHIIDLDTGNVMEFYSDRIERLQAEIAAEHGYEVVRHRLELYCRKLGSGEG